MKKVWIILLFVPTIGMGQNKDNDGKPIEVGIKFTASLPVIGAQVYQYSPMIVNLYDSTGRRLESVALPAGPEGWKVADFSGQYPPGKYTLSYYSPGGDYAFQEQYFIGDSTFQGFSFKYDCGVYSYTRGAPLLTYHFTNYFIWPVCNSGIPVTDTSATIIVVVATPDGSPVRLADGSTATKYLFGANPGNLRESFLRYANGTLYRYNVYEFGVKRYKFITNKWVEVPY